MTTIAANRSMMASDSRVTVESKGDAYPAVKIMRKAGMLIGASGHGGDCTRFLKWAAGKFADKEPKWHDQTDDHVQGIIVKEDGIYLWAPGDPEPEKVEAECWAIGSGGKSARAAMLMGADPVKAVEVACQVDTLYSAPPVQTVYLKEPK